MNTNRSMKLIGLATALLACIYLSLACTNDRSAQSPLAPDAIGKSSESIAEDIPAAASEEPPVRERLRRADPPRGTPYTIVPEGELRRSRDSWATYQVVRIVENGDPSPVALHEIVCVVLDPGQVDGPARRRIRFTQPQGPYCIGRCWVDLERTGDEAFVCPFGSKKLVRCGG